jgi:Ca2+-binding EF-hand superfamily protein
MSGEVRSAERLRAALQLFDADEDGFMSRDELKAVFMRGAGMPEESVDELLGTPTWTDL